MWHILLVSHLPSVVLLLKHFGINKHHFWKWSFFLRQVKKNLHNLSYTNILWGGIKRKEPFIKCWLFVLRHLPIFLCNFLSRERRRCPLLSKRIGLLIHCNRKIYFSNSSKIVTHRSNHPRPKQKNTFKKIISKKIEPKLAIIKKGLYICNR